MKILIAIITLTALNAFAQPVPGPTLPPPVSKLFSGFKGTFNPTSSVTIAASGTTSTPLWLKGFQLTGVVIPTSFTGTAISFYSSLDGVNFYPLKNTYSGTAVSYTVAPNEFISINPADFAGSNYIEIVSNATEAAQRTLNLATRGL